MGETPRINSEFSSASHAEVANRQDQITIEELAATQPEVLQELYGVFGASTAAELTGHLDLLTSETGLGLNELSQTIQVNTGVGIKRGTVAAALADPECPARNRMRTRYQTSGIEGVERKLGEWAEDDPGSVVVLSAASRQAEPPKKKSLNLSRLKIV